MNGGCRGSIPCSRVLDVYCSCIPDSRASTIHRSLDMRFIQQDLQVEDILPGYPTGKRARGTPIMLLLLLSDDGQLEQAPKGEVDHLPLILNRIMKVKGVLRELLLPVRAGDASLSEVKLEPSKGRMRPVSSTVRQARFVLSLTEGVRRSRGGSRDQLMSEPLRTYPYDQVVRWLSN